MDATLVEFNSTIDWMRKEIEAYNANHKKSKKQMFKLLEHNRRLIAELKRNAQTGFDDIPEESIIRRLELQLQETVESKNSAVEMWQQAVRELEFYKQDKQITESSTDVKEIDRQIAIVNGHYAKGLKVLSSELSEVRNHLVSAKEEIKGQSDELKNCKTILKANKGMLEQKDKVINSLETEKKILNEQLLDLEAQFSDKGKIAEVHLKENAELKKLNRGLSSSLTELNEKVLHLSHQKSLSEKDAKDSLLTAQEAVLQKKEVTYKEQLALKFIQELKLSISQEVDHATVKYRSEIKNIKKQNEKKIASLMQEIRILQVENSEIQSSFERAVREKQAVESKLDSLSNENANLVSASAYDGICHRMTTAEKARDEALLQVQVLEAVINDLQQNNAREVEFFKSEAKSWQDQFWKLQADMSETVNDRLQLTDLVTNMKARCAQMEKELELSRDAQQREVSVLKKIASENKEVHALQIQQAEDHFRKTISEFHHILNEQSKTSKKWKDTAHELTVKSEQRVKEMFQDIIELQQSNLELTQALEQRNMAQKPIPLSLV